MSKIKNTASPATPKVARKPIVPGELYWSSGTGVGVRVASRSSESRMSMLISISPAITLIPMDQAELLAQRYGVKKSNPKRNRVLTIIGVGLLTITAGLFGYANYSPVSYQDLGYRVLSDTRVEVDFELTRPAGVDVVCSLQALNNQFAPVGWIELVIPASDETKVRNTVALNTTELAVTGLVDECRLR